MSDRKITDKSKSPRRISFSEDEFRRSKSRESKESKSAKSPRKTEKIVEKEKKDRKESKSVEKEKKESKSVEKEKKESKSTDKDRKDKNDYKNSKKREEKEDEVEETEVEETEEYVSRETKEEAKMRPVELLERQKIWANQVAQILMQRHGYIDTSIMGAGKTFIVLYIAQLFKFDLLIVCPVTVIDVWKTLAEKYGIKIIDIISYQSLRATVNKQPKHGLLTRKDDYIGPSRIHKVSFLPNYKYREILKGRNILVVCDEFSDVRTDSDQHAAVSALLHPIYTEANMSRWALLSGTPCETEAHAINIMRMIGYISAPRMYHTKPTGEIVPEGLGELIRRCNAISATETSRVLNSMEMIKENIDQIAFQLYSKVLRLAISGAMDFHVPSADRKNGFYNITGKYLDDLKDAICMLGSAAGYDRDRDTATGLTSTNLGAIQKALVAIENAKAFDIARVSMDILRTVPGSKVIIAVNFNTTIALLTQFLMNNRDENKERTEKVVPLILNGGVPVEKRPSIIADFNNNPKVRILIMNTVVGGRGISLHDTVGNAPRFMFISPNYSMGNLMQAAYRISREGVKSPSTVRIFYGKGYGAVETRILAAIARKSDIMKRTWTEKQAEENLLPDSFESYEEP